MSTLCECALWACSSGEAMAYMLATKHHPSCPKGWPRDALRLIVALGQSVGTNAVSSGVWQVYLTAREALQTAGNAKG